MKNIAKELDDILKKADKAMGISYVRVPVSTLKRWRRALGPDDTAQRERKDKRALTDRSDPYNGQGTVEDAMKQGG